MADFRFKDRLVTASSKEDAVRRVAKAAHSFTDADEVTELVCKRLGWKWDDDKGGVVDKDGNLVGWDEFDSVEISPVHFGGHTYSQVNIWGDGTLEYQDEEGESLNWCEFEQELTDKVCDELKKSATTASARRSVAGARKVRASAGITVDEAVRQLSRCDRGSRVRVVNDLGRTDPIAGDRSGFCLGKVSVSGGKVILGIGTRDVCVGDLVDELSELDGSLVVDGLECVLTRGTATLLKKARLTTSCASKVRKSTAAGSGDKLVAVYCIYSDGQIGYNGYLARVVSEAKMETLSDKTKGIGCTTNLRLARRYTEDAARKTIDFLKSCGALGEMHVDVVSVADEEKRLEERKAVDLSLKSLYEDYKNGKVTKEEYESKNFSLMVEHIRLGFYEPALRDGHYKYKGEKIGKAQASASPVKATASASGDIRRLTDLLDSKGLDYSLLPDGGVSVGGYTVTDDLYGGFSAYRSEGPAVIGPVSVYTMVRWLSGEPHNGITAGSRRVGAASPRKFRPTVEQRDEYKKGGRKPSGEILNDDKLTNGEKRMALMRRDLNVTAVQLHRLAEVAKEALEPLYASEYRGDILLNGELKIDDVDAVHLGRIYRDQPERQSYLYFNYLPTVYIRVPEDVDVKELVKIVRRAMSSDGVTVSEEDGGKTIAVECNNALSKYSYESPELSGALGKSSDEIYDFLNAEAVKADRSWGELLTKVNGIVKGFVKSYSAALRKGKAQGSARSAKADAEGSGIIHVEGFCYDIYKIADAEHPHGKQVGTSDLNLGGLRFNSFKELTRYFDEHYLKGRGEDSYWNYYPADVSDGAAFLGITVDLDGDGNVTEKSTGYPMKYAIYHVEVSVDGKTRDEIVRMLEDADVITGV